jgi:hypothetical protein
MRCSSSCYQVAEAGAQIGAYSGEIDQGSGVMPISVPVDSDQVIGAERRWRGDCGRSDRNRQEEVEEN